MLLTRKHATLVFDRVFASPLSVYCVTHASIEAGKPFVVFFYLKKAINKHVC